MITMHPVLINTAINTTEEQQRQEEVGGKCSCKTSDQRRRQKTWIQEIGLWKQADHPLKQAADRCAHKEAFQPNARQSFFLFFVKGTKQIVSASVVRLRPN